jgi:hypothetical protein
MSYYYPELQVPIGHVPKFPKLCPCCEGPMVEYSDGLHGPKYICGGQYRMSDVQIQNRYDNFWGLCPEKKLDEPGAEVVEVGS